MLGIKNIKITPDLLARACAVDEFKGTWTGLEHFTTGLSVLNEVARYGARLRPVFDPLKERAFNTALIRTAHEPGKTGAAYRAMPLQLEITQGDKTVGLLEAAQPEDIEALMEKLAEWTSRSLEKKELHPLVTIAVFTGVFLQISPFATGNMKTVRFLVLLLMLKAGYSYAPYVPLDRIMDRHAQAVFTALKHTQDSLEAGKIDWAPWLECFFLLLQDQAQVLKDKLQGQDNVQPAQLPPLSARVMRLFEDHDRLQMKQIISLTGGRRSTLKLRMGELVDDGYLRRHGDRRATWYSRV
jgi:Fic family protein